MSVNTKNKAQMKEDEDIAAMEAEWIVDVMGEPTIIDGRMLLRVIEKEMVSYSNTYSIYFVFFFQHLKFAFISDGKPVTLPANHFKDGWAKYDQGRKKKLLNYWRGIFMCIILGGVHL